MATLLESSSLTQDDGEYWTWWICYFCCCCLCIFFVWAGVAVIFVSSLATSEEYSPEDAQGDGPYNDDTSGSNYDYMRVVSMISIGATAAFTFKFALFGSSKRKAALKAAKAEREDESLIVEIGGTNEMN